MLVAVWNTRVPFSCAHTRAWFAHVPQVCTTKCHVVISSSNSSSSSSNIPTASTSSTNNSGHQSRGLGVLHSTRLTLTAAWCVRVCVCAFVRVFVAQLQFLCPLSLSLALTNTHTHISICLSFSLSVCLCMFSLRLVARKQARVPTHVGDVPATPGRAVRVLACSGRRGGQRW